MADVKSDAECQFLPYTLAHADISHVGVITNRDIGYASMPIGMASAYYPVHVRCRTAAQRTGPVQTLRRGT